MNAPLAPAKTLLATLISAVVFLASVCAANAQTIDTVLLTINVFNPDAVTITTTGGGSDASVAGDMTAGIDLLNLITGTPDGYAFTVLPTSLTVASGSAGAVDYNYSLNDYYSGARDDLNLYSDSSASESFSAGAQAFTGSLTVDLSAVSLRTSGTGTIITGYLGSAGPGGTPNTAIGLYQIVDSSTAAPEPASWMLFCGALAVLGAMRRYGYRIRASAKANN